MIDVGKKEKADDVRAIGECVSCGSQGDLYYLTVGYGARRFEKSHLWNWRHILCAKCLQRLRRQIEERVEDA